MDGEDNDLFGYDFRDLDDENTEALAPDELENWESVRLRNDVENFVREEFELGQVLFPVTPTTHRRWERLIEQIIKAFTNTPEQDHEFELEGLAQRMCNYLSLQLQRSARMKFDFKLQENVRQYVSYDTLFGWKKDLVSICKYKVDGLDVKGLKTDLDTHLNTLDLKYKLARHKKKRLTFTIDEVRVLLESVLKVDSPHRKSLDVSIQLAALITTFFYTAARPSSIIPTMDIHTFLRVQDLRFRRRIINGQTVGIGVSIELLNWKGFSHFRNRVRFNVGAVKNRINLLFELGLLLVATLFRRGAWPDLTPEELWDGDGATILLPPVSDEFLESPVFLSSKPAGTGLTVATPLKDAGLRQQFRHECIITGLDYLIRKEPGASLSVYCLRRGGATTLTATLGVEKAQKYLGHQIGGKTLLSIYDQSTELLDMGQVTLGEGDGAPDPDDDIERGHPFHYSHLVGSTNEDSLDLPSTPAPKSIRALIVADPKLYEYASDIKGIELCLRIGSDDWMQFPNFRFRLWRRDQAVAVLGSCKRSFKKRVLYWKTAHQREIVATKVDQARLELVSRAKREEMKAPSSIPDQFGAAATRYAEVEEMTRQLRKEMQAELVPDLAVADGAAGEGNDLAEEELDLDLAEPDPYDDHGEDYAEGDIPQAQGPGGIEGAGEQVEGTGGIEGAGGHDDNHQAEGTKGRTSTYEELQEEKRLYFLGLVKAQDSIGTSCDRCIQDPTIDCDPADLVFVWRGYAQHQKLELHSIHKQLWRYLWKATGGVTTYRAAFTGTPPSTSQPVEPNRFECGFCNCVYGSAPPLLRHIHKFHLDDIPTRYHPAFEARTTVTTDNEWTDYVEEAMPIIEELPGLFMAGVVAQL